MLGWGIAKAMVEMLDLVGYPWRGPRTQGGSELIDNPSWNHLQAITFSQRRISDSAPSLKNPKSCLYVSNPRTDRIDHFTSNLVYPSGRRYRNK
jgi:hypothetical protein